ncbi:hypothetical protein AGLY_017457 [Aphis glycines]|uniref:Uncharacterized protein n=1 Tax=Aphis glycines TaxID=307491 RepID=A0A6G0SX11_APHGL|nr:hypothetical protein AGLY_017457 [Aphis glycines]
MQKYAKQKHYDLSHHECIHLPTKSMCSEALRRVAIVLVKWWECAKKNVFWSAAVAFSRGADYRMLTKHIGLSFENQKLMMVSQLNISKSIKLNILKRKIEKIVSCKVEYCKLNITFYYLFIRYLPIVGTAVAVVPSEEEEALYIWSRPRTPPSHSFPVLRYEERAFSYAFYTRILTKLLKHERCSVDFEEFDGCRFIAYLTLNHDCLFFFTYFNFYIVVNMSDFEDDLLHIGGPPHKLRKIQHSAQKFWK